MMTQVYPKVILLAFDGNDGEASKYRGWLAAGVSMLQLLFVPALSGSSDTFGRRAVIYLALALHAGSVFALAAVVSGGSLAWVTACRLVTSVCVVILPVSQAVMIDLSDDGGKDATHGLGIAFGAFALGNSGGDIVGGSLAEHHRGVACVASGALASAALLSLAVFGWKETAPLLEKGRQLRQRRRCFGCCCPEKKEADERDRGGREGATSSTNGEGARSRDAESRGDLGAFRDDGRCWAEDDDGGEHGRGNTRNGRETKLLHPLLVLKVFLESRVLLQIACSYFLFVLSLNVFATGYNYVDYRFHWTPPEISYFFATYNILMALAGGWAIRAIVPKRLSEETGALFGIAIQACAVTLSGFCFRGWMLYPTLVLGALQNITEPCLQAVMATFVGADRQGGLQGAVMSLRVVGEGVAAPMFTQAFSTGSSAGFEQAPFFLAAVVSLISLTVTWLPLRKLDKVKKTAIEDDNPLTAPAAEGWKDAGGDDRGEGRADGEAATNQTKVAAGRGGNAHSPPTFVGGHHDDGDDDDNNSDSGLLPSRSGAPPVRKDGGDVVTAKNSSFPGQVVGQEGEQEAMGPGEGAQGALTEPLLAPTPRGGIDG
eukprot:g15589.t1